MQHFKHCGVYVVVRRDVLELCVCVCVRACVCAREAWNWASSIEVGQPAEQGLLAWCAVEPLWKEMQSNGARLNSGRGARAHVLDTCLNPRRCKFNVGRSFLPLLYSLSFPKLPPQAATAQTSRGSKCRRRVAAQLGCSANPRQTHFWGAPVHGKSAGQHKLSNKLLGRTQRLLCIQHCWPVINKKARHVVFLCLVARSS